MPSTFRADYGGIGRLLVSEDMQADMHRRAERMKAYAEADAPFDPADRDGDHYRDHFSVSSGIQERKTRRAVGTLTNDHRAAFQIEVGTKDTPAHHTLTRAIDAAKD